jgi:hypothetical protein
MQNLSIADELPGRVYRPDAQLFFRNHFWRMTALHPDYCGTWHLRHETATEPPYRIGFEIMRQDSDAPTAGYRAILSVETLRPGRGHPTPERLAQARATARCKAEALAWYLTPVLEEAQASICSRVLLLPEPKLWQGAVLVGRNRVLHGLPNRVGRTLLRENNGAAVPGVQPNLVATLHRVVQATTEQGVRVSPKTAYQQSLETAERLRLYDIDPQLLITVKSAGGTPGSLQDKVRAVFIQKVEQYTTALRAVPFLAGPPAVISNGLFTLGTVSGVPFRLTPTELLRHILAAGPSGSGKTSFLQPLALQFRAAGGHLIVADFKNDLQWLAARDPDFLILHPDVPLNILDHPSYVGRADYINMLITILTRSYFGGEHLR